MIYRMVPFSITLNDPNSKGMLLFDIESLRNDMMQTHGYCRPLIESDMWPLERPGSLTKVGIADDLE